MSKFLMASAAALLVAASPAIAAKSQSPETAASAEGGKQKGERKICRTVENSASRMKAEKVCLTRAEWKKLDAAE